MAKNAVDPVGEIVDRFLEARSLVPEVPELNADTPHIFFSILNGRYGVERQLEALGKVEQVLRESSDDGTKCIIFIRLSNPLYSRNAVVQSRVFGILFDGVSGEYGKAVAWHAKSNLRNLLNSNSRDLHYGEARKLYDSTIIPALACDSHPYSQVLRDAVVSAVNVGKGVQFLGVLARHIVDCGQHSEGLVAWFNQVDSKLTTRGFGAVRDTVLSSYVDWCGGVISESQRQRTRMCTLLSRELRDRRSGGATSFVQELVRKTRVAGVPTRGELAARVQARPPAVR